MSNLSGYGSPSLSGLNMALIAPFTTGPPPPSLLISQLSPLFLPPPPVRWTVVENSPAEKLFFLSPWNRPALLAAWGWLQLFLSFFPNVFPTYSEHVCNGGVHVIVIRHHHDFVSSYPNHENKWNLVPYFILYSSYLLYILLFPHSLDRGNAEQALVALTGRLSAHYNSAFFHSESSLSKTVGFNYYNDPWWSIERSDIMKTWQ